MAKLGSPLVNTTPTAPDTGEIIAVDFGSLPEAGVTEANVFLLAIGEGERTGADEHGRPLFQRFFTAGLHLPEMIGLMNDYDVTRFSQMIGRKVQFRRDGEGRPLYLVPVK